MKTKKIIICVSFILITLFIINISCISSFASNIDKKPCGDSTSKDGLWKYGSFAVLGYYGTEKSITLPTEIDGTKITGVCDFEDNKYVENITVPVEYDTVYSHTFSNLSNLKTVTFSREYDENHYIKRFEDRVFLNNKSVEKVVLPNRLAQDKIVGIKGEFYCRHLDEFLIGGQLCPYVFKNCTNLKEVVLPDDLKEIRYGCFVNCPNLKSITIPEGTVCIEGDVFGGNDGYENYGYSNLNTIKMPDSLRSFYPYGLNRDVKFLCNPESEGYKYLKEVLSTYDAEDWMYSPSAIQSSVNTNVEGDINRDSKFNISDVTLYQKYLAKIYSIEAVDDTKLDFDKNGKTNIIDCAAMQKAIAKIK